MEHGYMHYQGNANKEPNEPDWIGKLIDSEGNDRHIYGYLRDDKDGHACLVLACSKADPTPKSTPLAA
jgi:hypothetical protein